MAKNLVDGENIVIEENGNNINLNFSNNANKNLNVYSTTETVVGTWGNKPLYRKVYSGDLSQGTIPHGLTNFLIKRIYGYFYNSNSNNYFPLPSTRPDYPGYEVGVYVGGTNINLERGSGAQQSHMLFEIVLEYTKTTD